MYFRNGYTYSDYFRGELGELYAGTRPSGNFTYPTSGAELATATGFNAPDAMYNHQQTSGDLLDQVGSADLTPLSSIVQEFSDPLLADDNVYDYLTQDRCEAATSSVFDVTTGAFAVLIVARFTVDSGGYWGKRSAFTTGQGYYLISGGSEKFRLEIEDGTTEETIMTNDTGMTTDLLPCCIIAGRDDNTSNFYVHCRTNGTTYSVSTTYTVGSLTNASNFLSGSTSTTHRFKQRLMAVYEGANAQGGDDATIVENLASYIGFE